MGAAGPVSWDGDGSAPRTGDPLQIGQPFGIPFRLHWSLWFLVAAIVVMVAQANAPGLGVPGGVALGCVTAFLLVSSVALHEYGHAIAAQQYGIRTHHITLYPFGGIAAIEGIPEDPDTETVIALAGPAVNLALAALGGLVVAYSEPFLLVNGVARAFAMANLSMGLFNLIPAFPMDGGRVLRSMLARVMGWHRASRLAVRIGRVFAWGFLAYGLIGQQWGMIAMGVFLHVALNQEHQRLVAQHWEQTTGRPAPWATSDDTAVVLPRLP